MNKTNMKWDPLVRPPKGLCPEEFCFHWVTPGGLADMSGKAYHSRDEAFKALLTTGTPFPNGGCACTLGLCQRLDPVNGTHDYYEPCETRLEEAGLPWFYFCALESLKPEFQKKYLHDSEQMWGPAKDRHG